MASITGSTPQLPETPALAASVEIVRTLRDAGYQAFLAGGCVRDLLLGGTPKDYDVATSAPPNTLIGLFPQTISVGAHFGVVLIRAGATDPPVWTEVATFRHDGAYSDGRRPDAVRFSADPREDVLRRDFTINGMLLDPLLSPRSDPLLDHVGGRDDLSAKIVRAIGDPALRFQEDKLRMLRGIRFAARLGFELEAGTANAIRAAASQISQVSQERIRDELTRMLTEGSARRAFELLNRTGLLLHVLPEVEKLRGVAQPPEFHPEGDVWVHTLLLLEKLPAGCSPTLAWGALLHDIGKPATFQPPDPSKPGDRIRFNGHVEAGVRIAQVILSRLRFSNDDATQILALIANHMRFGDIRHMRQSTLKRFLRLDRFEEHLALHHADASSAHGDLSLYEFARRQFETIEPEAVRPGLLVTGRDLIGAGYRPGPGFKAMLTFAEDAQLEGQVQTQAEAMALVEQTFGAPG
jgi:poly(A) polymerase